VARVTTLLIFITIVVVLSYVLYVIGYIILYSFNHPLVILVISPFK